MLKIQQVPTNNPTSPNSHMYKNKEHTSLENTTEHQTFFRSKNNKALKFKVTMLRS